MTKKHYVAIATLIRRTLDEARDHHTKVAVARMARDLCDYFEGDNEKFDPERFMAIIGIPRREGEA